MSAKFWLSTKKPSVLKNSLLRNAVSIPSGKLPFLRSPESVSSSVLFKRPQKNEAVSNMGTALSFSGSVFKVYVYRPAAFLVLLFLGEFERQDTVAEFASDGVCINTRQIKTAAA